MRQLHYVNAQMTVTDVVCKSVLRYARALARANTSEVVSVPVRLDSGAGADAFLVLGPASQLFSMPYVGPTDQPVHSEATTSEVQVARELERQTTLLHPGRPDWPTEMEQTGDLDFDY